MRYAAEERLSEDSPQCALAHRDETVRRRPCIQLDSIGLVRQHEELRVVRPQELAEAVKGIERYECNALSQVSPYPDMFVFSVLGAPSLRFFPMNASDGLLPSQRP